MNINGVESVASRTMKFKSVKANDGGELKDCTKQSIGTAASNVSVYN